MDRLEENRLTEISEVDILNSGIQSGRQNSSLLLDPLPESVRSDLADLAESVKSHQHRSVESALQVGLILEEARARLAKHKTGVFWKWVELECGMASNTAQRMMRAHREFADSNLATVAKLELTAVYLLSATKCPEAAKDEARQIAQSGNQVSAKRAREIIEKHTPEKPLATMTDFEVIDAIRKAIQRVFEACPEKLRGIVAPKFRDFANELERTGDLSW